MIKLNTHFDKIYCISLEKRNERREKFKSNYKYLGTDNITVFNAVDGNNLDDKEWQFSKGALGCRMSHLSIYSEAIKKGYKKILVLEDDVIIKKQFISDLNEVISLVGDDYDMIYFGGFNFLEPKPVTSHILRLQNTLALHAVAINSRCLSTLIRKIEEDKRSVDSVIAELHPQLKVYGFTKASAVQRKGYSDILNKNVNYTGTFLGKFYLKISQFIKKLI
ncbi:glycosyltransferase family 25 protein [Pedobacter rhizosphaerae]|uniref:Glycosyltransferase family 25 (LPS biosynthesis protein) n=1 Tax=Pedobacter rhizosphaerae TaxID=390241 RepID=A0A1H9N6K4_9SPHI|nr:glycosyltransferase family 25 protein [Pedobacter rhizosphaerae]SER31606.1 Glycosyltransferase family 25 (LPS biosynthesis protein) [Pedobacter rhizosphaerae]